MIEAQVHGRSRRRRREEADRLVEAFERSGQSRRAFCREHGISLGTLDNYRKRCATVEAARAEAALSSPLQPAVTFVPLEIVEPQAAAQVAAAHCLTDGGATLFIEVRRGRRIGVMAGFDATTLTRLLNVLEQV
jgi:transposase-like protein